MSEYVCVCGWGGGGGGSGDGGIGKRGGLGGSKWPRTAGACGVRGGGGCEGETGRGGVIVGALRCPDPGVSDNASPCLYHKS